MLVKVRSYEAYKGKRKLAMSPRVSVAIVKHHDQLMILLCHLSSKELKRDRNQEAGAEPGGRS